MTTTWQILGMSGDAAWRDQINRYLSKHGYLFHTAYTPRDLSKKIDQFNIDLLLLGPNVHGETDFHLLQHIRSFADLPLLMQGPSSDSGERIIALEFGADDYMSAPYNPRELLARVRALQRRCALNLRQQGSPEYCFAHWRFVPERAQLLTPEGHSVHLTTAERRLLRVLVDHPQKVLSRDRLLRLSTDGRDLGDRSIDMLVWRLRNKLHPSLIRTERGVGYAFAATVNAANPVSRDRRMTTELHCAAASA